MKVLVMGQYSENVQSTKQFSPKSVSDDLGIMELCVFFERAGTTLQYTP